jgi:hypothetical protein
MCNLEKNLGSNLSKKKLLLMPKDIIFYEFLELDFSLYTITRIRDCIYLGNYNKICKINKKILNQ